MFPEQVETAERLDELAEEIAERVARKLPNHQPMEALLSPAEAAKMLSVSDRFLRDLLADGRIESIKIGGARRIDPVSLRAYLASCRVTD